MESTMKQRIAVSQARHVRAEPRFLPFAFSSLDPASLVEFGDTCPTIRPSPEVFHLHRSQFVREFWCRMRARMRQPVDIDLSLGVRRVQVLGMAVYEFAPDDSVSTSMWKFADGRPVRAAMPESEMSIAGIPHAESWMRWFTQVMAVEYAARYSVPIEDADDYCIDVFDRWKWKFGKIEVRAMREAIARGVAANPMALEVARRLREDLRPMDAVMASDYNLAIAQREDFACLLCEAPNLVTLFAVFSGEPNFPREGEPTQRLKAHLRQRGLSARLWRLLVHARDRSACAYLPFYSTPAAAAMIDLLSILDGLGCRSMPPDWLMREFLLLLGDTRDTQPAYASRLLVHRAALARIVALVARVTEEQRDRMAHAGHNILEWIFQSDEAPSVAAATYRSAPWSWFVRKAAAGSAHWEACLREDWVRWPVPFAPRKFGDLEAVWLDSGLVLWQESRVMRHCADKYAQECCDGEVLVVSLRRADRVRPVATARFCKRGSGWKLEQVSGRANSVPSDAALKVATEIEAHLAHLQAARAIQAIADSEAR